MFTIQTYLAQSQIDGIGVFAGEFIASGAVIWKFEAGFDVIVSDEKFAELSKMAQAWILHYGYYNKQEGGYVLCMDNAKYTNHSSDPNMRAVDNRNPSITTRDIQKGEEITENYYNFDELASQKLADKINHGR